MSKGEMESIWGIKRPLWGRVGNRLKEQDWRLEARPEAEPGLQGSYEDGEIPGAGRMGLGDSGLGRGKGAS